MRRVLLLALFYALCAAGARLGRTEANSLAPGWFANWVADGSQGLLAPDHDAVLRTTLDGRYQAVAERRLGALLAGAGAAANVTQGAVVILDPSTGAVRAPTVICHVGLVTPLSVDGCSRQYTTPVGRSLAGA